MWANEFKVAKHGRGSAIDQYREWLYGYIDPDTHEEGEILHALKYLSGKPIACWCRYSKEERTDRNACHGDVIVGLWQEIHDAATTDAGARGNERSEG